MKNQTTLFSKIQDFMSKKTVNNTDTNDLFRRAQIAPIGQIQIRGAITANGNAGTAVNRPEGQQRAANLIEQSGVKYIEGLTANFSYPRFDGNTSEWVGETEEGSVSNTTVGGVKLTPRRLLSYVEYSNEVVLHPNTDVAGAIEDDLIASIWEKVQTTMFNDIYTAQGATTVANYNDIVAFELAASQQKISNGIYIVSPIAASKLKKMMNGNTPVMTNGMINGFKVIETPSLDGEKVIFGDFSKLLLGQFGGLDVTCDDVTKQHLATIRLIINSWWDWGMIDPNAFAFATTATTNN